MGLNDILALISDMADLGARKEELTDMAICLAVYINNSDSFVIPPIVRERFDFFSNKYYKEECHE